MKKIVPTDAHLVPKEAKLVFKGKIFSVYQWPQKMFDGATETFEMLKRPDTVGVLAVINGKIVVLKQLQPHWKNVRFGLPMGRTDEGETPLEAAKRELLEETGLRFRDWKLINVTQGVEKIEWFIYLYLAIGLESQGDTDHENGEKIEVVNMPFEEAVSLSKLEPRLIPEELTKYKSLDDVMNAPEFKGQEIEV